MRTVVVIDKIKYVPYWCEYGQCICTNVVYHEINSVQSFTARIPNMVSSDDVMIWLYTKRHLSSQAK